MFNFKLKKLNKKIVCKMTSSENEANYFKSEMSCSVSLKTQNPEG